ncbi:DNA adenine methylase [Roseitalea porphyridii]|uniref:DNA adenine methylase n=2 Tax=Roseitalea porphyridii TaxID=1852022 RepID=A0A4V1A4F0_9HYPH|nr:DNA adenine methylase [Roseitalea porphyridii]
MQASASPFRYPGGKGFLTGLLANETVARLTGDERRYAEPFCGGAGAALNLLKDGTVARIALNDFDIRIYSAWTAIVRETDRFIASIRETHPTIATWRRMRQLVEEAGHEYDFDLGFAVYFLNRTSTAGIVLGSGPIGGFDQSGKWKIDVRYYADSMIRRIAWIGAHREQIETSCEPADAFLRREVSQGKADVSFYFVDPPYIEAGSKLYLNAMDMPQHRALAQFLRSGALPHWVLTYDDDPFVRTLYEGCDMRQLEVNYSLRRTRKARELIIRAA